MPESLKMQEFRLDTSYELNVSEDKFFEQIKKVNLLPFKRHEVYYSDNKWDFSENIPINLDTSKLRFNFKTIPNDFQDDIKKYILVQLIENQVKIQTLHRKFSCLRVFFKYLSATNIYHIQDISLKSIENFCDMNKTKAKVTQQKYKEAILNFYTFYSNNITFILTDEIKEFLEDINYTLLDIESENNKYKDIPHEYFNNLMKCLVKSMNSDTEILDLRATACLLIILSQTGLRASELGDLTTNDLKKVTLYDGKKSYFLEYRTWKRESGNNIYTTEKTYINDLSRKAFNTLVDILKTERTKRNTDYLFFIKKTKVLPLQTQRLRDNFLKFYFKYGREIGCIDSPNKYPELQTTIYKDEYILSYPASPQYRVHVCTELYNGGVPLKYIQKFMGHLTSEMQGYYVRPSNTTIQEDLGFSKQTMINIISGDVKLLGSNAKGFTERIQEFINENNYNIDSDINAIADKLLEEIPIRAKTGGVCIKGSKFRECSNDAMTNEFYCAYGVCPNIFHFYYMANISYRQSKELRDNIELSKKRNHMKQAEKETNMLNTIVAQKLLPELDELKSVINKNGEEYILSNYEDLKEIVENIEKVYEEALAWKVLRIE